MTINKRKRDGTWFYRFNQNRVPYQQYGFPTYNEAKAAENQKIKDILDGKKKIDTNIKTLSVRDAAQEFYNSHASKLTSWFTYPAHLIAIAKHFRHRRLIDLVKEDAESFMDYVRKNGKTKTWKDGTVSTVSLSEHTIQHYFTTLKLVINWWIKEKKIGMVDPFLTVKLKEIPKARVRFLYPAEEKILTPIVRKYDRMWPYYLTALETGLRQWNLCTMRVIDVDFSLNQVYIPKSKNGSSGYIPISERLRPWLIQWATGKRPDEYILGTYSQDTVSHNFTEIVREAGIIDFTFHDLRHTFAYNLLRQKVAIYIVSKLLLHKNIKTTENHYGHLAVTDLGNAVDNVNGILSSGVAPEITPKGILKKEEIRKDVDNQL